MVKEEDVGSSSRIMSKSQLRKVAREELNETAKNRKLALSELREWISLQERDKYACLLDAKEEFLLRFLRMQKMDVQKAAKVLDNYVGFRTDNPEWFDNLDIKDQQLNDVISSGYLFVLPGRDVNGRRVVFSRACCSDSSRFSSADIMRAHLITYEALLLEEECQINGISYLFDEEDITFSNVSMWTPTDVSRAFRCAEKAVPIRHKEMNFVSMPWTMTLIYQFAKSLLSHKLRSRLHTHSNFDKVREFFPVEHLPKEYGGTVPMSDMIDSWKVELEKRREKIQTLDSVRYYSDNDEKVTTQHPTKTGNIPSKNDANANSAY